VGAGVGGSVGTGVAVGATVAVGTSVLRRLGAIVGVGDGGGRSAVGDAAAVAVGVGASEVGGAGGEQAIKNKRSAATQRPT
jgi:hypothetical protein